MTSPIAEMPGTLVRNSVVDLDVAAIERQAGLGGAEPVGHRAAAGRDEQLLDRRATRVLPSAACISIVTPAASTVADVTLRRGLAR